MGFHWGTDVITEHCRFQLEASKLGRDVVFQVTVFCKEERRRKRLFAATQCSDPFHFLIQFIIREAPDFETLLHRFVHQLDHRGFEPIRMRIREEGKWSDLGQVPASGNPDAGTRPPRRPLKRRAAPKKRSRTAKTS